MEHQARGDESSAQQIAHLRARVDAGDRDAAGPLGELLARQGDQRGAIQVWAAAYGDRSPGRKRLSELLLREGDLVRAVSVWEESGAVWSNPNSLYRQYLATLPDEERREAEYDEPEEMAGTQTAKLLDLLAEQGEQAVVAQLRAWRTKPDGSAVTQ